jgi:hypothetical protein
MRASENELGIKVFGKHWKDLNKAQQHYIQLLLINKITKLN